MELTKATQTPTIERFFEPCVLYLLTLAPSYGYELKRNLEDKCHCSVDTGNLYRALRKLDRDGYIHHVNVKSEKGPIRNLYSITSEGEAHLQTWITNLVEQQQIISKLVAHYHKRPIPKEEK